MSQWCRTQFGNCILSCRLPALSRVSKLPTLHTHSSDFVSMLTSIQRHWYHSSLAGLPYRSSLFACRGQPLNHRNTVSWFDSRVALWPFFPRPSYGDHASVSGLPISSPLSLYIVTPVTLWRVACFLPSLLLLCSFRCICLCLVMDQFILFCLSILRIFPNLYTVTSVLFLVYLVLHFNVLSKNLYSATVMQH